MLHPQDGVGISASSLISARCHALRSQLQNSYRCFLTPAFSGALLCLLCTSGCRHASQPADTARPHALPVTLRAAAPQTANPTGSDVAALSSIRSRPEYRQAEIDCKHHDYLHAAELLTRLSKAPGNTQDQRAFCLSQANICRKDAGMPEVVAAERNQSMQPAKPVVTGNYGGGAEGLPDCGPRALVIAAQRLGVKAELAALDAAAGTDESGTSMEGLSRAAKCIGLEAEGIQTSREALPSQRLPAIAWYKGNHFVVVTGFTGKGEAAQAQIRDPNQDHDEAISQESLLRRSGGYLLLLKRKQ